MPNTTTPVDTRPRVIDKTWGISIGLAVALFGGIATNLLMFSSLREAMASLNTKVEVQAESLKEIKLSVASMATSSRLEINELRAQVFSLREQMAKLEARIPVNK